MTTVYVAITTEPEPQVLATSLWRAEAEGYAQQYEHENRGIGHTAHVLQVNVPEVK